MHAETNPINSKRITKTEGGWGECVGGGVQLPCHLSVLSLFHSLSPSIIIILRQIGCCFPLGATGGGMEEKKREGVEMKICSSSWEASCPFPPSSSSPFPPSSFVSPFSSDIPAYFSLCPFSIPVTFHFVLTSFFLPPLF